MLALVYTPNFFILVEKITDKYIVNSHHVLFVSTAGPFRSAARHIQSNNGEGQTALSTQGNHVQPITEAPRTNDALE